MFGLHKAGLALLLLSLVTTGWSPTARADCNNCGKTWHCKLQVEEVQQEKHCWQIELKQICVPRVVFPWQKCCGGIAHNGAHVRTVKVLKKHNYECPQRTYSFEPESRECQQSCSHNPCRCDHQTTP